MGAVEIALKLYAAIEAGAVDMAALFHQDAFALEHPNVIKPRGARSELAQLLANAQAGASLLASQRYQVRSALEHGDVAAIRLTWTGVVARDAGPFKAGQALTAHIAQFISVREGKIASIETYDCYEPF